jgi:2-keto-4-pentenoate hydratase/2-oxohepta-3-ene-1,7-dioic acid hydratase in catechol pathway
MNELIAYTSKYISLEKGDLFLTGTPAGVGPMKDNDTVEAIASLNDKVLTSLKFKV